MSFVRKIIYSEKDISENHTALHIEGRQKEKRKTQKHIHTQTLLLDLWHFTILISIHHNGWYIAASQLSRDNL